MHRTAEELTIRCKLILDKPDIVLLVERSSSPTAAYDMVKDATRDDELAKAARWLAIIRRDYLQTYTELTKHILCHANCGMVRKGESS